MQKEQEMQIQFLSSEDLPEKETTESDNHDGVITHLEPDILQCEVKWALETITKNKASGSDGIPVELFQILKDDAVKVLHSICQQFLENSVVATGLLKVPHNCTHLTC